jgi:hypothetical protein
VLKGGKMLDPRGSMPDQSKECREGVGRARSKTCKGTFDVDSPSLLVSLRH